MAEFTTLSSPTTIEKPKRHIIASTLFASPMSPTSTLDAKPFSILKKNPFSPEPNSPVQRNDTKSNNKRQDWAKLDTRGIGLAIVDNPNESDRVTRPETRMVLFGSHLKIQIPPLENPILNVTGSPKSADFGIRTRNSRSGFFSARNSGSASFSGSISVTEMELSEDYTCVITHGPNPKTTHIFDNCVVQSCCGVVDGKRENSNSNSNSNNNDNNLNYNKNSNSCNIGLLSSENFLSSCFTCKRNLGHGNDIYMYRGEKAFCSQECRYEGMMMEEREVNEIGM